MRVHVEGQNQRRILPQFQRDQQGMANTGRPSSSSSSCSMLAVLALVMALGVGETRGQGDAGYTPLVTAGLQAPPVKIAAFNIQVFGKTKYNKGEVTAVLKEILARYDLTLVQEIRDSTGTYFPRLVDDLIEAGNQDLAYVISPRLGRTSSKEQYAYLYNQTRLHVLQTRTYSDPGDRFQREPYCVLFETTDSALTTFGVIGIHTQPDDAPAEIDALVDVYDAATSWFGTEDIILMGDFNADCSYVTKSEWADIRLRTDPHFTWLIGDDVDTTVKQTHCAYDRFVTAGPGMRSAVVPDSAKIFKFDDAYGIAPEMADDVSDHYPIEMELYGKVKQVVLDAPVDRSFTVIWTSEETEDPSPLFPVDGTVDTVHAGFQAYRASNPLRTTGHLEADVLCDEALNALHSLIIYYPNHLSKDAVAVVDAYYEAGLLGDHSDTFLPTVSASTTLARICKVEVCYSLESPYTYKIILSRIVN